MSRALPAAVQRLVGARHRRPARAVPAGRLRGAVLLAVLLTLVCGCANAAAHSAAGAGAGAPAAGPPAAAAAGGACFLLDFGTVRQLTGVSFDVAAASQSDETFTCVLQGSGGSYPDLTLSVTPTDADPAVFGSTVTPKGAASVGGLGRAGYTAQLPATGGAGPAVEVGWLSANGRLLVLRYRSAPAGAGQVAALTPRFADLARKIDQDSN